MHRDLKLENILIDVLMDNRYSIKIIDWGFSTNFEIEKNNKSVGTLRNTAPEVNCPRLF